MVVASLVVGIVLLALSGFLFFQARKKAFEDRNTWFFLASLPLIVLFFMIVAYQTTRPPTWSG